MTDQIEQDYKSKYDQKSVLIIGAGPCGLSNLKYLNGKVNVICIECKEDLGGQWCQEKYTEETHPNLQNNAYYNQHGVLQSSMYENLICDVPKSLMIFKDTPANQEFGEFMTCQQFYQYLQDYSLKNCIKNKILFKTYVQSVRLAANLSDEEKNQVGFQISKKFLVQIVSNEDYNKSIRFLQADYVIVANGHFSVPNYPDIPNKNVFKAQTMHTHNYRVNKTNIFQKKHLVIYGCGISSQDIVYILLKKTTEEERPQKITMIGNEMMINFFKQTKSYRKEVESGVLTFLSPYIKQFESENSLVLENGDKVENIDIFMYATGYQYAFPFLNFQRDKLIDLYQKRGANYSLGPLYLRTFSVREPNLIFVGILQQVLSTQQGTERQAILVSKVILDEIKLPTQEAMQEDFNNNYQEALSLYNDGNKYIKFSQHKGIDEFTFFRQIANLCDIPSDEEYNGYLLKNLLPLYINAFLGNYPDLKQSNVSSQLPPGYFPKSGQF
ncbi:flavin-binding monooxygenase-like protein (macronuclear) [Tetrahymena thermophila SB210]|uniref:Flavin-binding monooxygenase-like protein n=1 Tax=Tetrahymena thermophila (strain SB210) TaxID=312017 RepID=I7M6C4_TETTS|nr:flavin-binding monooxygenase-like protein [Tetrahymena thermophila SB210]EAR84951.1 flavin-binding monooxygenase-like protein [Tetrahymena thermophila SB210]|eukprot:XP_001032614.1 flavin-binding monooxygenase-like protein [Tetrahymena thermophila SB210]